MQELIEVYRHWQHGDSVRHIARNLGLARNTVAKLVQVAEEHGVPRDECWSVQQWEAFLREHFPKVVDPKARSGWFQRLEAYRDEIREGLSKGIDISVLWQRLRDAHGLCY